MADLVREEDEQVYRIVLSDQKKKSHFEQFSPMRIYKRMLEIFTAKKAKIKNERENRIRLLAEEKTEWYRLLAL